MNPFEIEKKIAEDLKSIRTPEELKALQKWTRKAKKNPIHESKLESFGKISYSFEYTTRGGSGSKARYHNIKNVEYCYFSFLGLKIVLEKDNNKKYQFPDELFNKKEIWGDRKLKYIGWEYYPKQEILEWDSLNIENKFFEYLKEKKYYIIITSKKLYLSKDDSITKKIILGKRLKNWEKEETTNFSKTYLDFFKNKGIEIKDSKNYFDSHTDIKVI